MNNKLIYEKIIINAKIRREIDIGERHHIVPKSLGGTDDKENLVKLTFREHFVCHHLLWRFTTGKDKRKMCFAFNKMVNRSGIKNTSFSYSKLRLEVSKEMCGENNPCFGKPGTMLGKHHNDDTKKLISLKLIGNKSGLGFKHSEESKMKMRGRSKSAEHKRKLSEAKLGRPCPEETKLKLKGNKNASGKRSEQARLNIKLGTLKAKRDRLSL